MAKFIEVHPTNANNGVEREFINLDKIFAVVDNGDCAVLCIQKKNGVVFTEVFLKETYAEIVEKIKLLEGGGIARY